MPQYIITPWKYDHELLQVRDEFYGVKGQVDDELKRHAVNWVAAWRMRGSLPHAIESTAAIIDAQLHQQAGNNSPFSVRATYAAAVGRFVTGYCDITQTSAVRRSMFDVAKEIGLPSSFVELRHEATHSDLPSLQRLERHAGLALQWLWDRYWSKLEPADLIRDSRSAVPTPETRTEIASILSRFVSLRRKELSSKRAESSAVVDTATAVIRICLGRQGYLDMLCLEMCRTKMLVPAGRKEADSMQGAFLIWDGLLLALSEYQRAFLQSITQACIQKVVEHDAGADGQETDGFCDGIARWLVRLVHGGPWASRNSDQRTSGVICDVMTSTPLGVRVARDLLEDAGQTLKDTFGPLLLEGQ